ncbi:MULTISPECIES: alpha/beta-hydrolase family protein [unclassified Leucobacter]|uniref:alpha/beta hydrolase n=1 Tax=unclassified Leucobacter TaxID=2621730 RepID=UPI00165E60F8|nr:MULTISPECIES: alpha/beta hydrolase [unclassified Leucobacter]MBC9926126.1 alpha/beta-hydrolase family protein [Leucobacter sp. cx-169]
MNTRRWWHLDPGGSVLGLVCALLSLTPSLLPRPALLQGVLAALSLVLGYALGALVWKLVRRLVPWRPSQRMQRSLWLGYVGAWVLALAALTSLGTLWQNEVRALVEMPPLEAANVGTFLFAFVALSVVLLAVGKGLRRLWGFGRRRYGTIGASVGMAFSALVLAACATWGVTVAIDGVYLERNGQPDAEATEPASQYRSAGADSAIDWETLGRHGANFVGGGPSAAEIVEVTEAPAIEPIRVYAGLASAGSAEARAQLAVSELERTGAFSRSVLIVATPTGSGWLEPQTMDAVEYLYGGDTASVAMQYAYTPSWVSFVFDPDAPVDAARVLFDAVHERWSMLPEDDRPVLISYGLSLGAHGSQAVFGSVEEIRERTDGALFVGSPNGSALWRTLQAARDSGSPAWRPVLDGGREVRWMSQAGDQELLPSEWRAPRVLYLQHATDPVTWLGPELIWESPEWLADSQRASDVSPSMRWIPGVTAMQVTVDMLMGESVPARHGHNYGDVVSLGWREVIGSHAQDGDGLNDAAFARVQRVIEAYAEPADAE